MQGFAECYICKNATPPSKPRCFRGALDALLDVVADAMLGAARVVFCRVRKARTPRSTLIPFLGGLGSLINPFKQKRAPFLSLGYWAA